MCPPEENCGNSLPPLPVALTTVNDDIMKISTLPPQGIFHCMILPLHPGIPSYVVVAPVGARDDNSI